MRIAIISDIHANLEALEKALGLIREKSIDEIVCLGDTVGYGANPNECLALVRESTPHILLGNHDEAAVNPEKTEEFTPYARVAAGWTREHLSEEHKAYFLTLPRMMTLNGLRFAHSSPFEPKEWHYILSVVDAHSNFEYFTEPICFIGHSHVPGVFSEDVWRREVIKGQRFIVNVGSIGQPRDHDWRLSFGIFDTDSWTYENIRSEYDVKTASEKIRKAGLPKPLAERILVGR
jgi:diadenosine tetraphosphatase ApaH/serine/threonine PP2A family protein phosphatase